MKRWALILFLCFAPIVRADDDPMNTVTPTEDTQAIVHNPDMGWVLYENYPLDPHPGGSSTLLNLPNETFADVDNVALMFAWSDVETSPDHYDWSKVDTAYDYWHKRGKAIQLRMSTESLVWWTGATPPSGLGVPQYVKDKLPKNEIQVRNCEGIPYTVVDARDGYYLQRLDAFLSAVHSHFDKNRPVTLIDLRAFGLWGEWHTGFQYPTVEDRHAALSAIQDHFVAAFPDHYLALSFSYDPDSPESYHAGPTDHFDESFTKTYADFVHYSAFDHALTKPNITFRRDGVGGAVHSNERKLIADNFAHLKGPIMGEFLGGYLESKKGGQKWLDWKVADALSIRPNYINLLGYQAGDALAFTKEQPELVSKGLREMGYRFVPTAFRYPRVAHIGDRIPFEVVWTNRGIGRCLRDYSLQISLATEKGRVLSTYDAGSAKTTQWLRGETHTVSDRAIWDVRPGRYNIRLALIDPATGNPIALPLVDRTEDGWYQVGKIDLLNPAPPH